MNKISTFLWFDHQAEDAAKLYTSLFEGSKILRTSRYGDSGPGPKGSVMVVEFELAGQGFMALNGGPTYKLTSAVSLFASCETQDEVDRLWSKLGDGGTEQRCGWLTDRFGLTWQIVPRILGELMTDEDPAKSARVMKAMLGMIKLDIAQLKKAYEG